MEMYREQLDRNIMYSLKGLLQNMLRGKDIPCLCHNVCSSLVWMSSLEKLATRGLDGCTPLDKELAEQLSTESGGEWS